MCDHFIIAHRQAIKLKEKYWLQEILLKTFSFFLFFFTFRNKKDFALSFRSWRTFFLLVECIKFNFNPEALLPYNFMLKNLKTTERKQKKKKQEKAKEYTLILHHKVFFSPQVE